MSSQKEASVLLRSLRKAGLLSTRKAVVGSQPSQASTQKAVFHRNRRLTPCKRPAAAAGPGTQKRPPASASQAAAAEKTLRDVLMHVHLMLGSGDCPFPAGLAMSTQKAGDVLLRSLRKAGPLSTRKAVVGRVLSATARSLTQSNSQLVASQPIQALT